MTLIKHSKALETTALASFTDLAKTLLGEFYDPNLKLDIRLIHNGNQAAFDPETLMQVTQVKRTESEPQTRSADDDHDPTQR